MVYPLEESNDSELVALKFSYCCFSKAFCVSDVHWKAMRRRFWLSYIYYFLQIFSSVVEGTVIFNAVDGPDSGVVTGIVSKNAPSSTPHSPEIAALVDAVKAMLHQKSSPPAFVKACKHQLDASFHMEEVSLLELTPTQMILELADRSTTTPSVLRGASTLSLDPILSTSAPSLTPVEEGDFILEEIEACLTNDSISPGIDDDDFNPGRETFFYREVIKR
ncbi:hypothetical protein Tco_1502417 [Tanacetum coccineum]